MTRDRRAGRRGRARDLRDLGRPRAGDDLPLALPARAAGLLDCPIHGVAVDDWSVDDLREHARAAIVATGEPLDEAVFERLAARLSYLQGDFNDEATYEEVAKLLDGVALPVVLPRDPALPLRQGRRRPHGGRRDEERPDRRREAVRPRPRVRARPRRGAARLRRRVADLPHRPLPREDGAPGDPLPALRERDPRAALEPQLRRGGADHDGRELRRADARPLLRPGRRAPRRRRQPPDAARRGRRDGAALPPRPERDQGCGLRRLPGDGEADPREYVRGQVEGYRSIPGVAPDSTTETFAALRLDIDNWRWEGVPFFIRTGKQLPVTQTEVRLHFKRSAEVGLGAEAHHPEANQLVIRLDPTTGIRVRLQALADRVARPEHDHARHAVRRRGRRGADAVRGAPALGSRRRRRALHAPGRRRGGVARDDAADRRPAARPSLRARHLGAGGGRSLVAGFPAWHEPWLDEVGEER